MEEEQEMAIDVATNLAVLDLFQCKQETTKILVVVTAFLAANRDIPIYACRNKTL
jgi:hypothetical protein